MSDATGKEEVTDPMPETLSGLLESYLRLTEPADRDTAVQAFEAGACGVIALIDQMMKFRTPLSMLGTYHRLVEEAGTITRRWLEQDSPPVRSEGG